VKTNLPNVNYGRVAKKEDVKEELPSDEEDDEGEGVTH